jgi:hypothetical protein
VAFSDRHSEFLVVVVLLGVTVADSLPVLRSLGCEGWCLAAGITACVATAYSLLLLLLHSSNLFKWLKRIRRKP